MLAKYVGRHKRGLLAINVFGLFLLLIFISSLFVRSVQASTQYNILYFHAGTMNEDPGSAKVSTKISAVAATLTLRPNSDVSTGWTPLGGGYNYVEVESQDGDTSYVTSTRQNKIDQYGLTDRTTESGTISNVRVNIYAKLVATDDDQVQISVVVTELSYVGSAHTLTTSYALYYDDWPNNPATGQPWTWTEIDALVAEIKSLKVGAAFTEERVTQLYVDVTYSYDSSISWSASYWADNWWVGVSGAWSVVFYFDASGGELATGTVTVRVGLAGPPGADKSPVSQSGVSCSGDTGSSQTTTHDVSGWADRDATTTWLNDDAANPSRTLTVTITITNGGPIAIEYDALGSPGNSRLNTGTIVPENFLQLIFVAPFIPLVANAAARWSEKGRRKAGPKG